MIPSQPAHPPAIDFDLLCQRLFDDHQLASDLVGKLVQRLDSDLAQIKQAVAQEDSEALRQAAHKLKGSAANLAAEPLRQACSALEYSARQGDANLAGSLLEELDQAVTGFKHAAAQIQAQGQVL